MSAKRTIAALLAGADALADADRLAQDRRDARVAWVHETMAKIRAAARAGDAAWERRLDAMEAEGIDPDEAEDLPELPEEAAQRALMEEIRAVCDHDRWPRELHWGGL